MLIIMIKRKKEEEEEERHQRLAVRLGVWALMNILTFRSRFRILTSDCFEESKPRSGEKCLCVEMRISLFQRGVVWHRKGRASVRPEAYQFIPVIIAGVETGCWVLEKGNHNTGAFEACWERPGYRVMLDIHRETPGQWRQMHSEMGRHSTGAQVSVCTCCWLPTILGGRGLTVW